MRPHLPRWTRAPPQEVGVFRHKDGTQEFEVLPNDKALTDRVEARKLVSERYKKIKERVRAPRLISAHASSAPDPPQKN